MEGCGIRALELWAVGPGGADRRTLPCDSGFPVTLPCDSDCFLQANPTCELLTHFPHLYELNLSPQNSCPKVLTPNVMVFGDEGFGK